MEGLNWFHGANLALNSDVDQDTFGKVTKHNKHDSQEVSPFPADDHIVRKVAKVKNRYNQVPHLTQETNGKVTHSQLDISNDSQEVSPFPPGDHKAHINRRCKEQIQQHKTHQHES